MADIALPTWSTACKDWRERIRRRESLVPCKPIFQSEADAALNVFKSLRVFDIPGRPTFGEICEPWVFDFVGAIFGALNPETGVRLIEEFMLLISKKNFKSTLAAGIMITALIRNFREYGELLILAPTKEVADNSFKPAAGMVRSDPELREFLHVQDNLKQITHLTTQATLKVVSADNETVGGKKAAFVLFDELWIFGKRTEAEAMFGEATGGRATRKEGFVIYLSTHSDAPPAGVFKSKLDIFRNIRDGKVADPTKLGVLYEFPEDMIANDEYLDEKNWYITNPNNCDVPFIRGQLTDASDEGKRRIALAKWLNVEIGMNLRNDRWKGANFWEVSVDETMATIAKKEDPFEAFLHLVEVSECVTIGVDGGGLDDLFGFSAIGRLPAEYEIEFEIMGRLVSQKMKPWITWSHAWCHEGVLTERQKIASALEGFRADKDLTIVDNKLGDIISAVEIIKLVKEANKLGGVGVDPANIGELKDMLDEADITEDNKLLFDVPQGFGMMNAIKTCERRLARGMLHHHGGRMMNWCVGNLKIEPTATAIRATKQAAGDYKIDPVMALFDAATVMLKNPEPNKKKTFRVLKIT